MSVRFDQDSDRATCSDAPPNPTTTGITITGWGWVSVDRNDFSTLVRVHGGAVPGTSTALNCATNSDGVTTSLFTPSGSVVGASAMAAGAWSRWAVTMQGTSGVVYRADAVGSTSSASGTVGTAVTPTGVTLGGRSAADATEWFNGRLAHVRVWSGVFNQASIEAEWASAVPVTTSGLWADYPLSVHTDLTDHSGNGHHLVAGATSTTTEADPPLAATAVLAATLPALTVSMSGTATATGTATVELPALTAALVGTSKSVGTLSVVLPTLGGGVSGARNIDLSAVLAEQHPATVTIGARRWAATLEAQ